MSLPRISSLRADLVPHRDWAVSRWFYADPIWYYHRRSAAHEVRAGGKFYQLVDPDLRELCRLLNDAGIRTTPSCQGHSYPRERFEQIWQVLKQEEGPIRGPGLAVKDCESDRQYLFQDPDYPIPWNSFDHFYHEAAAHQNVGYLGLLFPAELDALKQKVLGGRHSPALRILPEREVGELLGGSFYGVRIDAIDPKQRAREWKTLTTHVREALKLLPLERVMHFSTPATAWNWLGCEERLREAGP